MYEAYVDRHDTLLLVEIASAGVHVAGRGVIEKVYVGHLDPLQYDPTSSLKTIKGVFENDER